MNQHNEPEPAGQTGGRIALGDILVLVGVITLLTGLALFDWRLAVAAAGGLVMLPGWFMIFRPGNGR